MVENNENHCRRAEKDGQSVQIAVGNHRDDVVCGVVDNGCDFGGKLEGSGLVIVQDGIGSVTEEY